MIRNEAVRFKVLRNGSDYGFIQAKSVPHLRCRSGGEIKLSLQGDFLPAAFDFRGREIQIDWASDEIQPVLDIDGVKNNLGVFAVSTLTEKDTDKGSVLSIEAYDRCWRVRETRIEDNFMLGVGTSYIEDVSAVLTMYCGVSSVIATPHSAVLTENREQWKFGDSFLSVVNTLLKEINYKQLWFDQYGNAILQPKKTASAENIQHILSNREINRRDPRAVRVIEIESDTTSSTDVYNAANVFMCSCANPDKSTVMVARSENNNPQSPISIPRRGRRIMSYENLSNIASQAELQKYTDFKRDRSLSTNQIITCTTLLHPGFGVEDVVGLQTADGTDAICIETDWDMELKTGGKMTHRLERLVYNFD